MRVDRKGSPRTEAWDHPAFRDDYLSSVSQALGTQTFQTHQVHLKHYALTYTHSFHLTHNHLSEILLSSWNHLHISEDISLIVLILCDCRTLAFALHCVCTPTPFSRLGGLRWQQP